MGTSRIVVAQGVIDGVNRVFATGQPYVPQSTAYILNGRLHSYALTRGPGNWFGYGESNPDGGQITVDQAPLPGDVVQLFFTDRQPVVAPTVTRLTGTLQPVATHLTVTVKKTCP